MHNLTRNFDCWIAQDGQHFNIRNKVINTVNGNHRLGEYATFVDGGKRYLVTIKPSAREKAGIVDLKVQE